MPNETAPVAEVITATSPEAIQEATTPVETPQLYAGEATTPVTLATAPGAAEAEDKPSTLDNILTLGIVGLLAAVVIALVIRRTLSGKKAAAAEAAAPVEAAPAAEAPTAPGAAGEVKLHNVDPKTAAMLMAIVADKMQKPINELRFISIKEVE